MRDLVSCEASWGLSLRDFVEGSREGSREVSRLVKGLVWRLVGVDVGRVDIGCDGREACA